MVNLTLCTLNHCRSIWFYYACIVLASAGGLPNVANPDAWIDGWGLVLPIFIVTALAILPFSIMYCVLYNKRAREEERRAISEQRTQANPLDNRYLQQMC